MITPELQEQLDKEIEAARRAAYQEGYDAARRKYALLLADELNDIVNMVWLQHRNFLQRRANEIGRPLHQAIPGMPDVTPFNQNAR